MDNSDFSWRVQVSKSTSDLSIQKTQAHNVNTGPAVGTLLDYILSDV